MAALRIQIAVGREDSGDIEASSRVVRYSDFYITEISLCILTT